MQHNFTYKESPETGNKGWVLDRKPYFDPMDGMGVAHDVLEEMPHGGEQPHDELIAIGAMMYGRGYDIHTHFRGRPLDEIIAYEFEELYRHAYGEEGYRLVEAPKTRPLIDDEEEEFIINSVGKLVEAYIDKYDEYMFETEAQIESAKAWIPHAQNWLRIGFRKAHKRFQPRMQRYDVSYMFEQIRDKVDSIKDIQDYDTLKVRISYKQHELSVCHGTLWGEVVLY